MLAREVEQAIEAARQVIVVLSLGALPDEPPHKFQGRSRELLALERLLHRQLWAVVRGGGGAGKTTLAADPDLHYLDAADLQLLLESLRL